MEAGLRAAFRVQTGGRRSVVHSRWTPVLVWASAAAATVALALVLIHPTRPSVVSPGQSASPRGAAPAVEMAAADDSLDLENDFIPVPNAARIEPNEDVNLVRLEVSRSDMMAMGIPVSADNASETVLADVVLGADGMARAVRLVGDGSSLDEE